MSRKQTPSQTVGPFFAYGLTPEQYGYSYASIADGRVAGDSTEGQRIRITGRVLDGDGQPVSDAMIEIWQANAHGRYNHPDDERVDNFLDPDFTGFGRVGTNADGVYVFETIKPAAAEAGEAPHLNVTVFMRGLLNHVFTRIYFSDEDAANREDKVLNLVPEDRRATVIANLEDLNGQAVYRLDIHMQGENETVFFDL